MWLHCITWKCSWNPFKLGLEFLNFSSILLGKIIGFVHLDFTQSLILPSIVHSNRHVVSFHYLITLFWSLNIYARKSWNFEQHCVVNVFLTCIIICWAFWVNANHIFWRKIVVFIGIFTWLCFFCFFTNLYQFFWYVKSNN